MPRLIQRFQLAVWPDCPRRWRNIDRWPDSDAKRIAFDVVCRLDELVAADVGAVRPDDDDVPYLRFDPKAQAMFDQWQSCLESRLRGDELPPALESHLAKYRSLIPSLALLIHLADDGVEEIPVAALDRAIRWGHFLESHANRLYASAVHSDITSGRCLAKKILDGSLADRFTVKDVYRPNWSGLSSSEEAQAAIELLVDLDWLEVEEIRTPGRPRIEHRINPRVRQITFGSSGSTHEGRFPDS